MRVIERLHSAQWVEIAEDELQQQFPSESAPLCRITLLHSSDSSPANELIVTFHHAMADGMSAFHLIHELCTCYQQIIEGTLPELTTEPELTPPLEQLLEAHLTDVDVTKLSQILSGQPSESPYLLIEQTAAVADRQTRLIPFELDQTITLQLKQRCRDEQTTVHGALCAALSLAYATQSSAQTEVLITCGSSVDLRPDCEPPVTVGELKCITSNVTTSHYVTSENDFWELARECQREIANFVQHKIPHYRASNAELINTYQADFLGQMAEHNMGRNAAVHISNLGQSNLPTSYGSIALEGFHFIVGLHLIGACSWLGAVTINQTLFGTLGYITPITSPETAHSLADLIVQNLNRAVD